ncbi:MAG: nucleotide pyrophosphohydrolase [Promethearchaeota archaeon]
MVLENSINEIQNIVNAWILEHGGYWSPLSMISAIIEELGEVAREVNSLEGYKPKKSNTLNVNLGQEIADLLFSTICLANFYKIDLGKEFKEIIKKYSERDSNRFLKFRNT